MINWKKKDGSIIETNEQAATVAKAMKLGWVRVDLKKAKKDNK